MREFFHYFFGKGNEIEFRHFSLAHILPIVIAVVVIYLIFRYRDKIRDTKFDEKFRLVLVLYYVEEYSIEDIAGFIGKSTSAVKMRLQKGRKLLSETYRKEYM